MSVMRLTDGSEARKEERDSRQRLSWFEYEEFLPINVKTSACIRPAEVHVKAFGNDAVR
jgi:hypothetical protein